MNRNLIIIFSLTTALMIGMSACGGEMPPQKPKESRLERMKPKAGDRLSKLMDRNWDNLEYIMYGFINYDVEKIKIATTNLDAIGPYMAQRISPAHQEHIVEWKEQCSRQQDIAAKLRREFEEQNFQEARNSLHELIENCMDCHKVYRKHLLKPTGEETTP
jgi:cytochrome c556